MQGGYKNTGIKGTKRLFIAVRIDCSDRLRALLDDFRGELKESKIKWSDPRNFHVTVAFLGETGEKQIPSLGRMLEAACSAGKSFELRLRGTGLFRNTRDPRVIWAGLQQSAGLEELFRAVSTGLNAEGISFEDRPFRPHLTLGRVKQITDTETLETLISRYSSIEIQVQQVNELILYESILQPEGPVYKPMGKYRLGKA